MTNQWFNLIDLRNELEDYDYIHAEIEKATTFKGTNFWILAFAIVIASVGLNTNSTAVIIGAMLISPLMGPINGMGYSIATYNFPMFRQSFKHFTFAVFTSLITSTLYFLISPVSSAHSELLARTSPTIYDVLIALFGGLAGIVAISSKLKGNVIPGVAIATALMPPLCTAGYGLATWQPYFFLGAIYLFTINTVFIAISSVWVSQILGFPIRSVVDAKRRTEINRAIWVVITATLLPSLYFGYQLVVKEQFTENAARFVQSVTVVDGSYLLKHEVNPSRRQIHLVYAGNKLTDMGKSKINKRANDFDLKNPSLFIEQGFATNENYLSEKEELLTEKEKLERRLNKAMMGLEEEKRKSDSILARPMLGKQMLHELAILFPYITACSYADTYLFSANSSAQTKQVGQVVVQHNNAAIAAPEKDKIKQWLVTRLNMPDLLVVYEDTTPEPSPKTKSKRNK